MSEKMVKYRGVKKIDGRYYAIITRLRGKYQKRKEFSTALEAARYHDKFKKKHWNYSVYDKRLNFPQEKIANTENIIENNILNTNVSNTKSTKSNKSNKSIKSTKVKSKKINKKSNLKKLKKRKIDNVDINIRTPIKRIKYNKINNNILKRRILPNGKQHALEYYQDYRCNICNCLLPLNVEKDHIISLNNGGLDHPINLQVLCISCHKWKSTKIDRNPYFLNYISKMNKIFKDRHCELYYQSIVNKIISEHSKKNCECGCKFTFNKNDNDLNISNHYPIHNTSNTQNNNLKNIIINSFKYLKSFLY